MSNTAAATGSVRYEIRDIGSCERSSPTGVQAADLAALHAELLSHSPLVLMGREFVEEFYYTVLPAERLISGAIAYVDGKAAGFIVATDVPDGFMSQAMRKFWPRVCWIILKSVLRNPGRIRAIKEAYQIQSNVKAEQYGSDTGELLSLGVLPEFRTRSFVKRTSIRIGADLLERCLEQLASAGKKRIRAIVDKDNLEAQLFYRAQGWRVGLPNVKGWRVPTMEFLVDIESGD